MITHSNNVVIRYHTVVERQFKCHEYQVFPVAYTLDFWELFSLASQLRHNSMLITNISWSIKPPFHQKVKKTNEKHKTQST